jgi:hypothetical protein
LIDVDQRNGRVRRPDGQHAFTLGKLACVIRRRIQVHHQLRASSSLLGYRTVRRPRVFADRDTHLHTSHFEQRGGSGARSEITLLVEHAIVGQQALVVDAGHLSSMTHCRRVVQIETSIDEADHRNAIGSGGGNLVQRLEIVVHETRLQQQVFRRIARDGQLGEHRYVGAGLGSTGQRFDNARHVSLQVTDNGVELTRGHPDLRHVGIVRPIPPGAQ